VTPRDSVTLSRAQEPLRGGVTVSRCERDRDIQRDSDSFGIERRDHQLQTAHHLPVDASGKVAEGAARRGSDSDTLPAPPGLQGVTVTAPMSRMDEHKARLARDPRFAGWAAGAPAGPDLGPLADPVYPDVQRRMAERNELRRVAAVSALRNGGKHLTPQERAENRLWAGLTPLAGPLSDGEPS